MKISELSLSTAKDFCGASGNDSDELFGIMLSAAKRFILDTTGLSEEQADECDDLTVALLVLVNDMFTTRTYAVDSATINPFAEQVIALHRRNLL